MKYSTALCTHNGAKYIKEQLTSILKQTYPPSEIIVCDDASQDATAEIVFQMAQHHSQIKLYENKPALGVKKNFERAIGKCSSELIFLSDQDDTWHLNKAEIIINAIQKNGINIHQPFMLFTDLEVVDEKLNKISNSFWQQSRFNIPDDTEHQLKILMLQNFVTGASSVISKKLFEIASPFPQYITMHDHWLALVAVSYGQLIKINTPLVNYRQHSSNVIGAAAPNLLNYSKRLVSKKISIKRINRDFWIKKKQIEYLLSLSDSLPNKQKSLLENGKQLLSTGGLSSISFASKIQILPMQTDIKLLFYLYLFLWPITSKQSE